MMMLMKFTVVTATVASCAAFLPHTRLYGEWILWHSTFDGSHKNMNRMVIHIYPKNKFSVSYRYATGPVIYNRQKWGNYRYNDHSADDDEDDDVSLTLHLNSRTDRLISICGVGLNILEWETRHDHIAEQYEVSMHCLGTDDILLTDAGDENSLFHLVRSVRVVEPRVEVGLSSFVMTQLLGLVINECIHILLHFPHQ